MPYVIGKDCVDVNDRACMDVCPVDCIYVGDRKSYINAAECIDCGACEVECPVEAIFVDRKARGDEERTQFVEDQKNFFTIVLPGRDTPLGAPGGARKVGELGVDTPFIADYDA
ncbi:(4Fe-4S)-binding protein [Paractinoplanes abujensis]|uniref:Ferredoxin n=1 Tax=Paractinoplanes abujensis TaxID=882441 RepID=A0A7W7G4J6_9ACTN|nr:ferredoxin family protein [Actinoplanes abujensis]MBB4693896.1 NAD-dependent dihydropyrimidine dehydrogenase PreA subunit [Actinoplanes abujensis]GID21448.1 (4Fe-4S)-binding protein [Actinoplanes abujensis]